MQHAQNVRLMMMRFGPILELRAHALLLNVAVGVPHADGFTLPEPFLTSSGTRESLRDQNQILIVEALRSVAQKPPPAAFNPGPKSRCAT